jgi:hypothetical protein
MNYLQQYFFFRHPRRGTIAEVDKQRYYIPRYEVRVLLSLRHLVYN